MSYRHQILRNLKFGTLADFVGAEKEKNALRIQAGLTPYAIWSPAFGGLHHLVLEAEFESMAAFEAEHLAAKAIDGIAALNARQLECVIEGTAQDRMQRLSLEAGQA
ncbi:NIPSNAP family protein [Mycolicibacterium wolinskyi]|uniref:NIPSNAP domain-containing protein n=1 Tax=Mycolicibacterium wolinskyi TaxID=59750 RepID=A0A132PJ01_9MYCO|nr:MULTISPECIES: NIPSNAP family protein [Mycolicibacterium]KWX22330.1 hypothetical protein AFM11_21125 [Mycolicibacterium wolinskyi]MCV7287161.1 NIPSNAP family protein [Mycolicibacterium wolinskyi]MCV7292654.1 NIPSNAP family protein [Mycolicibacterium goodii]ORX09855.1 hypothetical protein AWC31_06490 [Mycolicibacterium wolinskyi]